MRTKFYLNKEYLRKIYLSLILIITIALFITSCKSFSYIQTSVPEEGGVNFVQITQNTDNVVGTKPIIKGTSFVWSASPQLALSPDGEQIAYITEKNNTWNIMLRKTERAGSAIQRTFRNNVTDLSWSPDGKNIAFSETRNGRSSIYVIPAEKGSILRQISTGASDDFNPKYSPDGKLIYFSRSDAYGNSIWSYNKGNNLYSQYSIGYTPLPFPRKENTLLCTRTSDNGRGEIWMIDYETGVETLILTDNERSFSTPQLSPDGQWIICMGNSLSNTSSNKSKSYGILTRQNLDIFAIRTDATHLTQLTYHPGNDCSPVWSVDGKSIFFISQRGTEKGSFNIWKMNFDLK